MGQARPALRRLSAFAIVIVAYTIFGAGTPHTKNPNEQVRIELTAAIGRHGSVAIDPVLDQYGTPFDRSVRDGKTYSDKAPGLSLAAVPIAWFADPLLPREEGGDLPSYWGLRHLFVWLLVLLPAALFPFLALEPRHAKFALIFALVTPVMTYSGVLFSHVSAGLLAAIACLLILRPGRGDLPSPRDAAWAGLALAAAATTEYPTVLFGSVLLPALLLRRAPLRTVAAFALGCAAGIVPCLVYHQLAFGSPFSTGYAFKAESWHASMHGTGFMGVAAPKLEHLWGVTLGAKRGIFFYCPLLLLIPIGFFRMEEERRHSSLPFVALALIYVLFAAGFTDWQAGWCAAARHLLPLIIVSIFPLARAVDHLARDRRLAWVLLVCVAFSLAGSLLSVSLTPFFPEHFSSPLGQLVLPMLSRGFAAPTLFASESLDARIWIIAGAASIMAGAVSWALADLMETVKHKVAIPVALVAAALVYAGLIWGSSEPLAEDQEQMRTEVLQRLGYGSTALHAR